MIWESTVDTTRMGFRALLATDTVFVQSIFADWPNIPADTTEALDVVASDVTKWITQASSAHAPLTETSKFYDTWVVQEGALLETSVGIIRYKGTGKTCHVTHHVYAPSMRGAGRHHKIAAAAFAYCFDVMLADKCIFDVWENDIAVRKVGDTYGTYEETAKRTTPRQQLRSLCITKEQYALKTGKATATVL